MIKEEYRSEGILGGIKIYTASKKQTFVSLNGGARDDKQSCEEYK